MKIDPFALRGITQILTADYVAHLVRYAVIAGTAYLLFYVWFRGRALGRKIQSARR